MTDFYELPPEEQAEALTVLAWQAVAGWDLGGEPALTLIKFRENAVFRVDAAGQRFVMRVHRAGYHTSEALESELVWMAALRQAGVATPEVVATTNGALYREVAVDGVPEARFVDVLSWVEGEPLGSVEDGVTVGHEADKVFFESGLLMARMHNHAQDWDRPSNFTRHAWDVDGLLGEEPLWGRFWELEALDDEARSLVLAARDRARDDLAAYGDSTDRYGLIHADFLPENLLVDDGTLQLIDFDDAGFGWHLFDVATSLFVVLGEPEFDRFLGAFLSGYRTERDLNDEHLVRLPLFFLLRGLAYLGWVHTRRETSTAQELTPVMVEAVTTLAADYLAADYQTSVETPSAES